MSTVLEQHDIENILKGITIPSPPQVIADLQMEMAFPDPDINAITRLINQDVGLAGSVLKTIRSPFYGNMNVDSIAQAVMILGLNTITGIVNTVQLRESTVQGQGISDEVFQIMVRFWDSATDVARCCAIIAQRARFRQTDLAYMLGLFHNAGIPLLIQRFEDYPVVIRKAYEQSSVRVVDIENQTLNTNHAVLSLFIARSWKLPEMLCDVIAQHHNGLALFENSNGLDEQQKNLAAILKTAEHVAALYRIIGGQDEDHEWNAIGDEVLEQLGLSEYDFEDILSYANEQGIGVQSYFI